MDYSKCGVKLRAGYVIIWKVWKVFLSKVYIAPTMCKSQCPDESTEKLCKINKRNFTKKWDYRWIVLVTWQPWIFCFFYWTIVDLQYCVSFRCIAKWFRYIYVCVYIYFRFFSIIGYYKILNIIPCAILLLIYFMYSSLYLLIPYSQFVPLPFGNHKIVFYVCESVSVLYIDSFVLFFRFPV